MLLYCHYIVHTRMVTKLKQSTSRGGVNTRSKKRSRNEYENAQPVRARNNLNTGVNAYLNNTTNTGSNTNNSVYGFNYASNPAERKLQQEYMTRLERSNGLPNEYPKLLPHQKTLLKHIRTIVMQSINGKKNHEYDLRGMVVNHTTGSGKTAMILGGILEYLKTGRRIFVVTTVSNKKSNSAQVYAENLIKFFPRAIPSLLGGGLKSTNYNAIRDQIEMVGAESLRDIFKQLGVEFHTFETLASRFGAVKRSTAETNKRGVDAFTKDLKKYGGVFMFDEAHELIQQSGTRSREAEALKSIQQILERYTNKRMENGRAVLHAYMFTATPGDTLGEWDNMLTLVRPTGTPRSFIQLTKTGYTNALNKARKYLMIDRVDISKNTGLVGKIIHREVPCDANLVHVALIVVNVDKILSSKSTSKQNPSNQLKPSESIFMKKFKQMQNYVTSTDISTGFAIPASRKQTIPGIALKAGLKSIRIRTNRDTYQTVFYSKKLDKVVEQVLRAPGKQLIYSEDKITLQILQKLLHDKNVSNIGFDDPLTTMKSKFIEASKHTRMAFCTRSSDIAKAMSLSNLPENVDGSRLKIIAVMGDGFQGLNIHALRGVHVVDTKNSEKHHRQLLGRVGRARSLNHLSDNVKFSERFEYITMFSGNSDSEGFWSRLAMAIVDTTRKNRKFDLKCLQGAGCIKPKRGYDKLVSLHRDANHELHGNMLTKKVPTINRIVRSHRYTDNVRDVNRLLRHLNSSS